MREKITRRPWTTREERRLVQLVNEGANRAAIAEELDRTLMAITRKLTQLRTERGLEDLPHVGRARHEEGGT